MPNLMVTVVLGLVAIQALFSVPTLTWDLVLGRTSTLGLSIAVFAAATAAWLTWWKRWELADAIQWFGRRAGAISTGRWLFWCMIGGVAIRVVWVLTFPAPLRSDHATYFGLAQGLAERSSYSVPNSGYAYWPPGYPFFLFVHFLVFGVQPWVPPLANLALFVATIATVDRLANLMMGTTAARLSTLVLVVWPNYIASTGLASKELVLIPLLPLALLCYVIATRCTGWKRFWFRGLTGFILGYAALTQPSLLLFPAVLLGYEVLRGQRMTEWVPSLAVVSLAMVVVIGPWTIRNYSIFNAWVPVSTSGGFNFYRANNSLATGGYIDTGEVRLDELSELEQNDRGYRLGKEWIQANPVDFLFLAGRKQLLFLGDDGSGIYGTLKRGLEITDMRYAALKAFCSVFWWALWSVILAAVWRRLQSGVERTPELSLLILGVLYFLTIHSVFESSSRYHVPLIGLLAILAVMEVSPAAAMLGGSRRRARDPRAQNAVGDPMPVQHWNPVGPVAVQPIRLFSRSLLEPSRRAAGRTP